MIPGVSQVPGHMKPPVRALAAALLAVIGAFVGSTLWSQRASHTIDHDAELISKDAAPTLKDISEARAALRDLQAQVARAVNGHADAPLDFAAERAKVAALIHHAMDLPTDTRETALFVNLHAALRSFDEGGQLTLDELKAGHRLQARDALEKKLRPAADEASLAARALIDYEAKATED